MRARAEIIFALPRQNPTLHPAMLKLFDMEKISTATSFAPGTSRMLGGMYPSKPRSAYAKSCTIKVPCAFARFTISVRNGRSTHVVVGLCGNEISSIFGGFGDSRYNSCRRHRKVSAYGIGSM